MDISVIGSGNMARGIGTRFMAGGHRVVFYSRQADEAMNLARELIQNNSRGQAEGKPLSGPLTGEVVVLAVPFTAVNEIIRQYYDQLADKIIIDITNPVNFETFEITLPRDTSGAEETAKLIPPGARLVKAFNTTFAGTLVAGQIDNRPVDVFVAGDDTEAKNMVIGLAQDGGLRGLDVGLLSRAQTLEGLQLIHMLLQQPLATNWMSTIKILS